MKIKTPEYIFLDADDTLWENEVYFREAKRRFALLLSSYAAEEKIMEFFNAVQEENIPVFGYGTKTCMLGFMDTASEICGGAIPGEVYTGIKAIGRELICHDVILIDGVEDTLKTLSGNYRIVVATKGDNIEQERKLHSSGLGQYLSGFEVMNDKTENSYSALAGKYGLRPEEMVMAGNSVRSDIAPVIGVGGTAIHIPHEMEWEHEMMEMPGSDRVIEAENFRNLIKILL